MVKDIYSVLRSEEKTVLSLRSLYERYGYKKYKMSKFEHYDLYSDNKSFLSSESIVTFADPKGKLLALKPDMTLSIVRNAPDDLSTPHKVYYCENVYRAPDPEQGIREIMQVGIEYIGDMDLYAQTEVLTLACRSLGEISGDFIMGISHLGIITALYDAAGLPQSGELRKKVSVCIADKNVHELTAICEKSGVESGYIRRFSSLAKLYGAPCKVHEALGETVDGCPAARKAADELESICTVLVNEGYGANTAIDFSITNDMDYYNGITFLGFVDGVPQSVLSGGRYDSLVKKLGKNAGAVGFAVYPDRLEKLFSQNEERCHDDTVYLVYGDASPDRVLSRADLLSAAGHRVICVKDAPKDKSLRTEKM